MNEDEQPEAKPVQSETPVRQRPDTKPPEHPKPVPDGEAIAEVGDAVGGQA